MKIFLDTSALFAGIWSSKGGARAILKLGELGAIQIMVDSQVIAEIEAALRRKAPEAMGALALLLDRISISIKGVAAHERISACRSLTGHEGDARILASAWDAQVDYFVTLDRRHFLDNSALLQATPFPLGTPGDFLEWFRRDVRE